jgi:hypothetical protein
MTNWLMESSSSRAHTALFKIRNQDPLKYVIKCLSRSFIQEQQGEWPGGGLVNNPILSVEELSGTGRIHF